MQVRRLNTLRDFLIGFPSDDITRFRMGTWGDDVQIGTERPFFLPLYDDLYNEGIMGPDSCGCALAWATTIPTFNNAGLRLRCLGKTKLAVPNYRGHERTDAASSFFGIERRTAILLFANSVYNHHNDPFSVIDMIERLVKAGEGKFLAAEWG
jgi:hypothetical protein